MRLFAGLLLLGFVASRVDLSGSSVRWDLRVLWGVGGALALLCTAQVLSSLRWRLVLGDDAPAFGYLCRIYFIGSFFSLFLPTSVGGDAVRAVAVARASASPGQAVSSVLLERLLGLIAMGAILLLGGVAAPAVFAPLREMIVWSWGPGGWGIAAAAGGALIVGALAVRLALRVERVRRVMADGASLGRCFLARPRTFGLAMAVSLLVQLTYVAVWYSLAAALLLPLPARDFLLLVPFVSLAAMLPITLSGLGVREGAWVVLLAPYGIAPADALAFSLLYLVALLLMGGLGGIAFALRGLVPNASTASSSLSVSRSQL